MHRITFGGNQYSYVKDVYGEQWDDYQLRSVCLGGNQPLFNLLKEYQIDGHPISSKYRHAAVTWYRKRLITLMDGMPFDIEACPKPPKDWDERMAQTKQTLLKTKDLLTRDFSKAGSSLKENSVIAGAVITEKATIAGAVISEKSQQLKEKIQSKEFGKKIMSIFGKKQTEETKEESKDDEQDEGK
jgi:hypothetical protein